MFIGQDGLDDGIAMGKAANHLARQFIGQLVRSLGRQFMDQRHIFFRTASHGFVLGSEIGHTLPAASGDSQNQSDDQGGNRLFDGESIKRPEVEISLRQGWRGGRLGQVDVIPESIQGGTYILYLNSPQRLALVFCCPVDPCGRCRGNLGVCGKKEVDCFYRFGVDFSNG